MGTTLRIWVPFNDKQKLMQADNWIDRLAWELASSMEGRGYRMCRMTF